ncbi:hypothetical protein HOLleu_39404 [Holothuria leucospilota]|uniref:Uncharacterized protein n=1 Tax=Holothuria leucospilota TaxID=206669 RepID=A0A9Q0YGH4_HOLLE|nr:hypothetical protein HOLleu_39404 [Holothuria leucospilota]
MDPTSKAVSLVESESRPSGVQLVNTERTNKITDPMDLVALAEQVQRRDRIHVRPSPEPPSKDPAPRELPTPQPNSSPPTESMEGKTSLQTRGNPYIRPVRDRKPPERYKDYILT